jgi:hypothetical protein
MFFFKKKNQKTSNPLRAALSRRRPKPPSCQRMLASTFQAAGQ